MRHLILTAFKSRKLDKISVPKWIYLATAICTLTILGVGIIVVYYKCKKNKCKKRSAKIYRLARNRHKTMETPGYNALPVYAGDGDDVYTREDNSTLHEEDSVVSTGVKQKQDHEVEAKSAFSVLWLAPPVTGCYALLRLSNCSAVMLLIKTSQVDIASRLLQRTVVKM